MPRMPQKIHRQEEKNTMKPTISYDAQKNTARLTEFGMKCPDCNVIATYKDGRYVCFKCARTWK